MTFLIQALHYNSITLLNQKVFGICNTPELETHPSLEQICFHCTKCIIKFYNKIASLLISMLYFFYTTIFTKNIEKSKHTMISKTDCIASGLILSLLYSKRLTIDQNYRTICASQLNLINMGVHYKVHRNSSTRSNALTNKN